jgi:N-acetylglucosamine kinase-like BadF-type ATPase
MGFNPYFIDSTSICNKLNKSILKKYNDKINSIFFYGAGCSSKEKNEIIQNALSIFFTNAKISINNDITAACYAVYDDNPNITCVLGTGSNSCYFDGNYISEKAPSLGFLVGDEASGNYFGKKILNLYFNNVLTADLMRKFESSHETNWTVIMQNIYSNNRANVYLSKYFPFVSKNKDHPIIKDLIYTGLNEFFNLHVVCYKDYQKIEVNFVGSVAYYLSNEIYFVAKKCGCKVGEIIKNPLKSLVDFHCKKIANS